KSRDLLNKNKNMNKKLDVKVQLRSDVTNWQNFFLSLFFISIYPLITYWKKRRFESKRWSNSDFAP
ncbi:MAG: hypothetical protein KDK36_12260, partial [Leptospiraceae bacterium]|nr:hypothetical protein [Leptospiraceae bacterium]